MILCEGDAPEGHSGWCCVHLCARILSSSLTSVSIFSVFCYSIVSISMVLPLLKLILFVRTYCTALFMYVYLDIWIHMSNLTLNISTQHRQALSYSIQYRSLFCVFDCSMRVPFATLTGHVQREEIMIDHRPNMFILTKNVNDILPLDRCT